VEPVFREHVAGSADRKASVGRVERVVLLKVEDESGRTDEAAEVSSAFYGRKSHQFSLLLGTYRWLCGWGRMS
jgi:hypothetical protein